MSEQDIMAHLDRWAAEFKQRQKRRGLPVSSGHETSRSYKQGAARDSRYMAKEKLK